MFRIVTRWYIPSGQGRVGPQAADCLSGHDSAGPGGEGVEEARRG
jgi:hypothetical protein